MREGQDRGAPRRQEAEGKRERNRREKKATECKGTEGRVMDGKGERIKLDFRMLLEILSSLSSKAITLHSQIPLPPASDKKRKSVKPATT